VIVATVTHCFSADHPVGAGHFPGNPVIPGALLLSEALHAIGANLGANSQAFEIRTVKFLAPARPGDCVAIEYSRSADGLIRFTGSVGSRTVVAGEILCSAISAA
jgi:3-hydroxymyristoyl/3-hydroxydecanoyl-(acyl carrier protein) dehydratase